MLSDLNRKLCFSLTLCTTLALLGACQSVPALSPSGSTSGLSAVSEARPASASVNRLEPVAELKTQDHGLKLSISYSQGFRTQALDCAQVAYARVSISGSGLSNPIYANGSDAQHRLQATGCSLSVSFSEIPYGLRIVSVELLDSTGSVISGATLKGVLNLGAGSQSLQLSYRQLPTAKAVEALVNAGPSQELVAQALDLEALQTRVDGYTGVSGTFPNESYTTHPGLINSALLASDLAAGTTQAASAYQVVPGSVNVTVSGLLGNDQISISISDLLSQSALLSNSGGNLANVLPGSAWPVSASVAAGAGTSYTLNLNQSNIDVSGGQAANLSVSAVPAELGIDTLSVDTVGTDQFLVISGRGFHTGSGVTSVTIGGQPAVIDQIAATRLRVTVPGLSAGDHVLTVAVGPYSIARMLSVRRIHYVNAARPDNNGDGSTWATAKASLQEALNAARSGDEIRIAEGTYTPGTNRSDSFALPDNVKIYGGFDAVSPAANLAQRSTSSDVTILSGEIGDLSVTADNSHHVVSDSGEGHLDGLTISAGQAEGAAVNSGGGILFQNGSLTLNDVRILNCAAANTGGGMYVSGSTLRASKLTLENNTAVSSGGGLYTIGGGVTLSDITVKANRAAAAGGLHLRDSQATLTVGKLSQNQATVSDGGALALQGTVMTASKLVLESNTAIGYGGAIDFKQGASDNVLKDSVFHGNRAENAGGLYLLDTRLELSNSVFAQNEATTAGGGIYTHAGGYLTLVNTSFSRNQSASGGGIYHNGNLASLANVLFWQSELFNLSLAGAVSSDGEGNQNDNQGNVIAADAVDPFMGSAIPAGDDGIWFNSDDGLRLRGSSGVIDKGLGSITGFTVPLLDLLGSTRPQGNGYDPGSYEGGF